MDDASSVIDLLARTPRREELLDVGDEMAVCLERFLTASVDERTMRRAQEALLAWSRRGEPQPSGA